MRRKWRQRRMLRTVHVRPKLGPPPNCPTLTTARAVLVAVVAATGMPSHLEWGVHCRTPAWCVLLQSPVAHPLSFPSLEPDAALTQHLLCPYSWFVLLSVPLLPSLHDHSTLSPTPAWALWVVAHLCSALAPHRNGTGTRRLCRRGAARQVGQISSRVDLLPPPTPRCGRRRPSPACRLRYGGAA
jgi:hypothetical protein